MAPEDAARSLDEKYRYAPWYVMVGVGAEGSRPVLYVYTKRRSKQAHEELAHGWMGYKVVLRASGEFSPLHTRRVAY
jgi:hypothetical protein